MTWQSWQIERTQILKAQHESGQSAPCEMYLFKLNLTCKRSTAEFTRGEAEKFSPALSRMCSAILLLFDFPTAECGGHSLCPTHVQNSTCFLLPRSQFSLTYFYSFESVKDVCRQKTSLGQRRDPLQREIFLWIVLYIGKLDQQKMKCLHFHISINFRENGQWPRVEEGWFQLAYGAGQ